MFDALRWEASHAIRRLARSPAFSLAVIASLAVGIGADVTMLGLVDSLLFRPPAHVRDVERVVDIRVRTYPDFVDLRDQAHSFSGVAAWFAPPRPYALADGDRVVPAQQMLASASLFPLLGVRPVLGRFYTAEEDRPGGPHVAVLGYGLWQRRFGGRRDVIGTSLRVAGDVYTVIGVAPDGFTGVALDQIDLFLPITTTKFDAPSTALTSRDYSWVRVVARLAPGVTIAQAQAEAKVIYRRGNPGETVPDWQVAMLGGQPADVHPVMELRRELATRSIPVALWLAGVATVVLLIACANVAGLLLARAVARRRDVAVRAALGASRGRLVAALALESGVLALAGGASALVGARWADAIIRGLILTDLAPVPSPLDARRLALTLGVTIATVLVCGVAPALPVARGELARELANGARGASRSHARVRRLLLVGQLGLAMVLVVGAALFSASLHNARTLDLGMSLEQVLISDLNVAGAGYDAARAHALAGPLLERLRAIPGVRAAALSSAEIRPGWISYAYSVPGRDSLPRVLAAARGRGFSAVTPGFLSTIGMRLERGRDFTAADRNARVVIVSGAFARLYWPGENPLGRCVKIGGAASPCNEVIGVARDRRAAPGDTSAVIEAFVPLGSPAEPDALARLFPLTTVALRVDGDPARVASAAQRVLEAMFPDVATIRVRPASSIFDRSLRAWRLGASLFTAFGAIALALGMFGVYAAMAHLVARRTREIAIRVALGATARDVSRLVVGETFRVSIAGVALGLVASGLVAHGVRTFLFGISPLAPAAYGAAGLILVLTAVAASAIPARRALRVDPTVALRDE